MISEIKVALRCSRITIFRIFEVPSLFITIDMRNLRVLNLALYCTYFPAAAAEHGCCAAAAASRWRELRLMTDVAESCAPFPLQLHHAHLQLHLLPLPLSLTDTDSTTVLDAHVFSPLHEFGASCPLPEIATTNWIKGCVFFKRFKKKSSSFLSYVTVKIKSIFKI